MGTARYVTADRTEGARFAAHLTDLGYSVDLTRDRSRPGRFSITAKSDDMPDPDDVLDSYPSITVKEAE